jgi:SHS2 domain-containing protein
VELAVAAEDREALLRDWLQLLLVRAEVDRFAIAELAVEELSERSVRGWGAGERVDPARHRFHTEIKGVSYHELAVRETPSGWRARIILDV